MSHKAMDGSVSKKRKFGYIIDNTPIHKIILDATQEMQRMYNSQQEMINQLNQRILQLEQVIAKLYQMDQTCENNSERPSYIN